MTDREYAVSRLTGDATCVLVRGLTVLTATARGIRPMMDWIASGIDLSGFSVADRIVGKAAALLFLKAGIVSVYGETMSATAADLLYVNHIPFACSTLTTSIVNRAGTGPCPMEAAVADISDPDAAYIALGEKVKAMRERGTF